ncbi:hypothetical protein LPJ78_001469 [Coemansia sp. RSA 989]|nr:hypothetical protein LPJ68_001028 [Coemansia sp. RSA 1086]KAJ1751963.1 hypothetical protein LPJ79_001590 [Coemansia sp. RSA 1821]KAJ1866832.1 hypothetical protein LPJ78_001469 [Coemansia sp. RSA 989]KAJ1874105.1 hypothetical protein LPJ55_001808 [Coemansia sp. RSA 990]KAJ2628996.1 hypothetical protein H4R22_003577 [Coemansia sp. RSA 1290]KAJ2671221.1 hypothetical protein IWW42_003483 [Coemansia sp. RSA 1085]
MDVSNNPTAADAFVESCLDILRKTTGHGDRHARLLGRDMVATIDTLQHTSPSKLSMLQSQLAQLQTNLATAQHLLVQHHEAANSCIQESNQARASISELANRASHVLDEISRNDPIQEARDKYMAEMNQRNKEFELKLRKEHDEFTKVHAKRLAKVYSTNFK